MLTSALQRALGSGSGTGQRRSSIEMSTGPVEGHVQDLLVVRKIRIYTTTKKVYQIYTKNAVFGKTLQNNQRIYGLSQTDRRSNCTPLFTKPRPGGCCIS